MTIRPGRARRPDDWPSSHARARADLSERFDVALDADESEWLGQHLEACADCQSIAEAYASQRAELRGLRDHPPQPPRDLWARTAAAIDRESRHRRAPSTTSSRRPQLLRSAILAAALVVAVAVGTLTSSQRSGGGDAAGSPPQVAFGAGSLAPSAASLAAGATPIAVAEKIEFFTRDSKGTYTLQVRTVDEVCPSTSAKPCDAPPSAEEPHPVNLDQDATSVFGSDDNERLIVGSDGTVSVLAIESAAPAPSATASPGPSGTPSPTVTATATASATLASTGPSSSPSPRPSVTSSPTPTPTDTATATASIIVTPSPDGGSIAIARDVALVGQSAAYSSSGDYFAFTARPVDGSAGPDIYTWRVGDAMAKRVTSDHRSVFGSWVRGLVAGSTVTARGPKLEPSSFVLDPASAAVRPVASAGLAWRPAVDPTGRKAVYWTGTIRTTPEPGYAPDAGRLVLGDWGVTDLASSAINVPPSGNQPATRHETTIEAGRLGDWDARWDSAGTHLAVWIADDANAAVGRLSLYSVDSFDGTIDLKSPLLDGRLAAAGYSIADGKLVWAEPAANGSSTGKIQLLAWTDDGVGTVETVTGPAIVIR